MRSPVWKLSVGAATLALTACGGSSSPTPPTSPSPSPGSGSNPVTINIVGENGSRSFDPNPASAGGQMVVFKNNDRIVHRVILNDSTIDTGDIAPGATSREIRMPNNGTNYHCTIHPDMIGSVNQESGGAPPPCSGPYC